MGVGVGVCSESGSFGTALHLAAFLGEGDIFNLLLSRGADVGATGGYFNTVLEAAIQGGNADVVELVSEHQATGGASSW